MSQVMEISQIMLYQSSQQINHGKFRHERMVLGDQNTKTANKLLNNQSNCGGAILSQSTAKAASGQSSQPNKKNRRSTLSSPNEEIIGVCNGIFAALISNIQLLEKYIYQKKQKSSDTFKKKRNSALADYLSKINEIWPFLKPFFYKSAIDELAKRVKEVIDKIWASFLYSNMFNTNLLPILFGKNPSRINKWQTFKDEKQLAQQLPQTTNIYDIVYVLPREFTASIEKMIKHQPNCYAVHISEGKVKIGTKRVDVRQLKQLKEISDQLQLHQAGQKQTGMKTKLPQKTRQCKDNPRSHRCCLIAQDIIDYFVY